MENKLKKLLVITLPIALGVFLIWYSFSKLTTTDIEAIKNAFKNTNYWWVIVSLLFGLISHASRAHRWKYLLKPLGYKPKFLNSFMTVMLAYLLNIMVPRSGEFARAGSISKYEKIPFSSALGTIVAERVADLLMLFIIIGIALFFQTDLISSYLFNNTEKSSLLIKLVFLIILPLLSVVIYKLLKKSNTLFANKIIQFVTQILEGFFSIAKMKQKWKFIFHTFIIWGMYIAMFYAVTFAIPQTTNLSFAAVIVAFVAGTFAMVLTNGGLGSYPLFVAAALTLYSVNYNTAIAFGWIMWTAQTLMVIILGGLSFIFIPLYNKN